MLRTAEQSTRPAPPNRALWPLVLILVLLLAVRGLLRLHVVVGNTTIDARCGQSQSPRHGNVIALEKTSTVACREGPGSVTREYKIWFGTRFWALNQTRPNP